MITLKVRRCDGQRVVDQLWRAVGRTAHFAVKKVRLPCQCPHDKMMEIAVILRII